MRRASALVAGGFLAGTIALAAADIPTRYVGAFPSVGITTSITGVFSGNALTLKYVRVSGTTFFQQTGTYTCTNVPPNKTRCAGLRRTDDGQFGGREKVTITWKAGQPVKLHFGH